MHFSLKNKLTLNFLLALSLVAVISLTSYWLTRQALQAKAHDARVINISGQQSTLSQHIVKDALQFTRLKDSKAKKQIQEELNELLNSWQLFHDALQEGDINLGLVKNTEPKIILLFDEMNPHFRKIRNFARKFTEINPESSDTLLVNEAEAWLDTILVHEEKYLKLTNEITIEYDQDVNHRLSQIQQIQDYLLVTFLILVVLEWIFIFRPTRQVTLKYLGELRSKQEETVELYENLKNSEEQVKIKNEELSASEEEIRQNMEELETTNDNLQKNAEELRQKNEILKEATELLDFKNKQIRKQRDQLFSQSEQLEVRNRNITNSIRYAKRIQEAILPTPEEVETHFDDAFVFFRPRDIVSGDFYWFNEKEDGQKILMAADCTGHGVPGALMTMIGNSLINEIVNGKNITEPSDILLNLDQQLIDMLQRRSSDKPIHDGMDMAVLNIDLKNCTLKYAAAHNPLYFIKNGEIDKVRGSKFPVGSSQYKEDKFYEQHEIKAQPGDTFYIFTDGFQDQYSEKHARKYMSKRFRNYLLMISHLPMQIQKQKLAQEFDDWCGTGSQTDDILVIGFKF
jgi:serine phosphatase RsbU (regulator of sigma subunit)